MNHNINIWYYNYWIRKVSFFYHDVISATSFQLISISSVNGYILSFVVEVKPPHPDIVCQKHSRDVFPPSCSPHKVHTVQRWGRPGYISRTQIGHQGHNGPCGSFCESFVTAQSSNISIFNSLHQINPK